MKNPLQKKGMTLLELILGMVVSSLVMLAFVQFFSNSQKSQTRTKILTAATSEIQGFFADFRKSMRKIRAPAINPSTPPGTATTTTTTSVPTSGCTAVTTGPVTCTEGATPSLTVTRTSTDPVTLTSTTSNLVLAVSCGAPPIADLPSNYRCPNFCDHDLVPVSFTATIGAGTLTYPLDPRLDRLKKTWASLCFSLSPAGDQLSLRLTYLVKSDETDTYEVKSTTENFTIPQSTSGPAPEIIGPAR